MSYGSEEVDPPNKQVPPFRVAEKLYKACSSVEEALGLGALDFRSKSREADSSLVRAKVCILFGRECTSYTLEEYEGLSVIVDAISRRQQVELAHHSLSESLAPPNRTNLHCHDISDEMRHVLQTSIWENDGPMLDSESYERPPASSSIISKNNHKSKTKNNIALRLPAHSTLSRVRWATLGYQYNWTERSYSSDQHVAFPPQLGQMAVAIAEQCGECIVPQAGIVNFYPEGQVMGGHVDDGEEAHENPVVSVSIGPPCVFILGGRSKNEKPVALLLRSGDCLVLGGAARLRYHGVSKVFVAAEGPPQALHPKTYADDAIHCAGCPCFLDLVVVVADDKEGSEEDGKGESKRRRIAGAARAAGAAPVCTCGLVRADEVQRVLKVLACARINLNLRQVYRSAASS